MTAGRPTEFSQELANQICELVSEGMSTRQICERDDMPGKTTIFRWLQENPIFRDQYARAKEVMVEIMAEETFEIADDKSGDHYVDEFGATRTDTGVIQRARLQIDARKWFVSKLLPKKYGDRLIAEHSGPGGRPVEVELKADESFAAVIAALEAAGRAKTGDPSGKSEVAGVCETEPASTSG